VDGTVADRIVRSTERKIRLTIRAQPDLMDTHDNPISCPEHMISEEGSHLNADGRACPSVERDRARAEIARTAGVIASPDVRG
jgi:hypothetical protein